jgi:hypothetical protein
MVDGDRATVIEISPRSGGNGIPEMLGAAGGINTVGASIDFALGARPPSLDATDPAPFGTAVFGSLCGLHLPKPVDEAQLRQRVPEVVECVLHVPASGQVPPWDHGGASVGFAVFRCPDGVPYDEMAARVRAAAGFGGTGE